MGRAAVCNGVCHTRAVPLTEGDHSHGAARRRRMRGESMALTECSNELKMLAPVLPPLLPLVLHTLFQRSRVSKIPSNESICVFLDPPFAAVMHDRDGKARGSPPHCTTRPIIQTFQYRAIV